MPARVLKLVPGIWRALAARMARGPKRAPFFFFLSVIFIYMSVCVYICWHTRSVANGGIKRSADNGDIETFIGLD